MDCRIVLSSWHDSGTDRLVLTAPCCCISAGTVGKFCDGYAADVYKRQADIIDHIFERYFSATKASDLMDHLCEAAIRSAMRNARILVEKPDD